MGGVPEILPIIVESRLSGYAWDSRCVYWGGVGTIDYAKDLPTHTVEIFAMTPVIAQSL